MYKIGDLSKKTGISVQTIRYYDQINLLKPSYCDKYTGYRYYLDDQLEKIKLIVSLKEVGLSLNDIAQYIKTSNINIILEKRKEYNNKMKQIEKILNKTNQYTIRESNYEEYTRINGIKHSTSPQALEVRDNNAVYYVVEKDKDFLNDFCIFKDNNVITLDNQLLLDDSVMNLISDKFQYVVVYIPIEETKTLELIRNKYKQLEINITKQGDFEYNRVKIYLNK